MKRVLIALILGLLWFTPLSAASVTKLYETLVTVDDQSRKSRLEAMQRGLRHVLIKVSGSVMVPNNLEKAGVIAKASQYVQQYRYQQGVPVLIDGAEQATTELWIHFDQKEIEKILKDNNFPIWGEARPLVLVWLAVEQGGRRLLVSAKDDGLARTILERESVQRGIPIKLPLLDEIDKQQLTVADVWGQFGEKIAATASRYGAQAVLTGRLFQRQGGDWQVNWDLDRGDEQRRRQSQGSVVELLISAGVDGAADWMAEQFALNYGAKSERVELIFSGLQSFPQFDKIMGYLNGLDGVEGVMLTAVSGEKSHFIVEVEGGIDALRQRIALGGRLNFFKQVIDGDAMERPDTLNYRLR